MAGPPSCSNTFADSVACNELRVNYTMNESRPKIKFLVRSSLSYLVSVDKLIRESRDKWAKVENCQPNLFLNKES